MALLPVDNIALLEEAGLLSSGSQRDAAAQALFSLLGQIGQQGAPRLSPTAPAVNLNAPMQVYNQALQAEATRGALRRKLAREKALKDLIKPRTPTSQEVDARVGQVMPALLDQRAAAMDTVGDEMEEDLEQYRMQDAAAISPRVREAVTKELSTPVMMQGLPESTVRVAQLLGTADTGKMIDFLAKSQADTNAQRDFKFFNTLKTPAEKEAFLAMKRQPSYIDTGSTLLNPIQDIIKRLMPSAPSATGVQPAQRGVPAAQTPTGKIEKTLAPRDKPENVAVRAQKQQEGRNLALARENLGKVESSMNRMLRTLDAIENDPELENVVGGDVGTAARSVLPEAIFGLFEQKTAPVYSRIDKILGGSFLAAFQSLRGGGQITENEGNKATAAITRLQNLSMNTAEYKEAIQEAREVFKEIIRDARKRAKAGIVLPQPKQKSNDILKKYKVK